MTPFGLAIVLKLLSNLTYLMCTNSLKLYYVTPLPPTDSDLSLSVKFTINLSLYYPYSRKPPSPPKPCFLPHIVNKPQPAEAWVE